MERELSTKELWTLKPLGCIVYDYVDKQTRGSRNKLKPIGTKGCFVGYMFRCLTQPFKFKETEFPQPSDFDQPPANASTTTLINSAPSESESGNLNQNRLPHQSLFTTRLRLNHHRLGIFCNSRTSLLLGSCHI